MRWLHLAVCLAVIGCGRTAPSAPPSAAAEAPRETAEAPREAAADSSSSAKASNVRAASLPVRDLPPVLVDLGTRTYGSDWPCFLGPSGDGKSSETGLLVDWPAEGPRIVWHKPIGEGYSMPVVALGRLYQFSRFGDKARLTCMNSETGEELWQFEYATDYDDMYGYNGGPRCSPVVDGERVYTFGAEGMLHCVRAVDGRPLWKVDTQARFHVVQNFFGVGSTPIVEGERLIVQVGGSPIDDQRLPPGRLDRVRPDGACVVAFDKHTGEVVYRVGDDLASYASPVAATIEGRRWCFVFARNGLLGFDPASGKLDFHYPWRTRILESVNASNPVVVGDQVFISECYGVGSSLLRAKPGGYDVVWSDPERSRAKAMMTHWNTPIHHEGYLYGSSGRHAEEAELRCIELASGTVMWSEPGLARSSLMYFDGHFVCLSETGELLLVRATPDKFDPIAQVTLKYDDPNWVFGPRPMIDQPAWAAPILSHGLLYVRGGSRLACLELTRDGG